MALEVDEPPPVPLAASPVSSGSCFFLILIFSVSDPLCPLPPPRPENKSEASKRPPADRPVSSRQSLSCVSAPFSSVSMAQKASSLSRSSPSSTRQVWRFFFFRSSSSACVGKSFVSARSFSRPWLFSSWPSQGSPSTAFRAGIDRPSCAAWAEHLRPSSAAAADCPAECL